MMDRDTLTQQVKSVKSRHEDRLMALPGVVGVGVGLRQQAGQISDEVCIVVMVRHKRALADLPPANTLPREIEGVPVDVQEVGAITSG